jgi:peptidoglycan DL-endopeptidase CwlO
MHSIKLCCGIFLYHLHKKLLLIYLGELMNIKNVKNSVSNLINKIKRYISEHPSKYKYILVSCSGVAVLTLTVIIVSTSSASLKDNTLAKTAGGNNINAQYTLEKYSADSPPQKSTKMISRGTKSSLDPMKGDIIKLGVNDSIVIIIQKKLMELDYIELDEPSEVYGKPTEFAIQLFQRKNELKITGEVDDKTYQLLISEDAKKYTVSIGEEGTDVEQLQMRLYELGYLPKVTKYFGTDTEAAVKEFQIRNGLYDDGNVGKNTREILYSAQAIPLSFYLGDQSDEIMQYQKKLYQLGYLTTKPDSKYGMDTVTAVKHFQENNGLIADGYMGPATKELLMSNEVTENAISIGDSGKDVTNVQKYLEKLGYLKSITGYFGSDTHAAVLNFQKSNSLSADGKVGSQTINKLLSSSAKSWSGNLGGSNSGGSGTGGSSSNGSSSVGSNLGGNSSGGSDSVNTASPNVDLFISVAKSKLGATYVFGAKGPSTFDCSGFVYWVLNHAGVKQGYMTSASWQNNTRFQEISGMSNIKRGDVISFNGHVGIALGNNQMIDASSSEGQVRITTLSSSYWTRNYVTAFRIF